MKNITIKVEQVKEMQRIPGGMSFLELCATEEKTIKPHTADTVKTGIALKLPPDIVAFVCPWEVRVLPRIWVRKLMFIDSNYQGEIEVELHNTSDKDFLIVPNLHLTELVFVKRVRATFIEETPTPSDEKGLTVLKFLVK